MSQPIKPGDIALIISAEGSFDLIGQFCEVLALHHGIGEVACRGFVTTCDTTEPCAFIELHDGSIWLWSLSRLMPLRNADVTAKAAMREVSHA